MKSSNCKHVLSSYLIFTDEWALEKMDHGNPVGFEISVKVNEGVKVLFFRDDAERLRSEQ